MNTSLFIKYDQEYEFNNNNKRKINTCLLLLHKKSSSNDKKSFFSISIDYIKVYFKNHYSNVLLKLATIFVKSKIEVIDVSTVKSNGTHKRKPPTCVVDGVQ